MSLKGVDDFNWRLRKLNETTTIKPFYSGDEDLDDFLLSDAVAYYKQRLAVTYIIETRTKTVAYSTRRKRLIGRFFRNDKY